MFARARIVCAIKMFLVRMKYWNTNPDTFHNKRINKQVLFLHTVKSWVCN